MQVQRGDTAILDEPAERHAGARGLADIEMGIEINTGELGILGRHRADKRVGEIVAAADGDREQPALQQCGRCLSNPVVGFLEGAGGHHIARVKHPRQRPGGGIGRAEVRQGGAKGLGTTGGPGPAIVHAHPGIVGQAQKGDGAALGRVTADRGRKAARPDITGPRRGGSVRGELAHFQVRIGTGTLSRSAQSCAIS